MAAAKKPVPRYTAKQRPGVFGALADAIEAVGGAVGSRANVVTTDKRDSDGMPVTRRQQQEDEILGLRRKRQTSDSHN